MGDRCLRKAAKANAPLPETLIDKGHQLKKKSHAEYWLKMECDKVRAVECADDPSIGQIEKFKFVIQAAKDEKSHTGLLEEAEKLLMKMLSEVDLQRAVVNVPAEVRLPIEDAPKDYWDPEEDIGHVDDTTQ